MPSPPLPSAQCGQSSQRASLQWCSCMHQEAHMASLLVQNRQPTHCSSAHRLSLQPVPQGPAGGRAGVAGALGAAGTVRAELSGSSVATAGPHDSQSTHCSLRQLPGSHLHQEAHFGGAQSVIWLARLLPPPPPTSSLEACADAPRGTSSIRVTMQRVDGERMSRASATGEVDVVAVACAALLRATAGALSVELSWHEEPHALRSYGRGMPQRCRRMAHNS